MPAMWLSAPGEERTITKGRASAVGRGEPYVTSGVVGECGRRCHLSPGKERAGGIARCQRRSDLGSECGLGVPMLKGWPFGDRDGRGTT